MTRRLGAEIVADERDLEALGHSWDELVRSMARPSPFLLHAWLVEWWRYYGANGSLAVGVLRDEGRLVGALPLCVRRRWGLRKIEFLGGSNAALADLMLLPDVESADAVQLADGALQSDHDYADLFGLPAGSRLAAALPSGSLRLIERIEAPVLDLSSGWEAVYRQKLSSKARSNRRRRQRKLEALGTVDVSVARTGPELEAALGEAFRVHERRWHGRRDTSGFATSAGLQFHRAALVRLAEQDVPRLVTLRLRGWAIAFALYLQLNNTLYGLNMGFDPAFAPFAPGAEAMLCALETAASEGVQRVEFLGAAADHKARFTDRLEPIYEGIGLAVTLRGRAAVEALTRSIRVRRQLKRSQTAHRLYYRVPRLSRS
jgi:CelD/BcsL family acetyltransferase involved in cellulose biosynthesis